MGKCSYIKCKLTGIKVGQENIKSDSKEELKNILNKVDKQLEKCNDCVGEKYVDSTKLTKSTRIKVAKTYVELYWVLVNKTN